MKRAACAISVIFFLGACATTGSRAPGRAEVASPALRHEVYDSLKSRNDSLLSLKGLATVRYGSKLFGVRGETSFALNRPDQLRIDGLSDFGAYTSQFVLKDGDLTILWPSQGNYYHGKADRDAMSRYLNVDVAPAQAVKILMSHVPLEDEEAYAVKEQRGGREIVLRGRRGEILAERKEGGYVPLRYTSLDEKGRREYMVDYSNYRANENDDGMLAMRIDARFFRPNSRIQVDFHDVDVNSKIEGKVFQIEIPPDATRIQDE